MIAYQDQINTKNRQFWNEICGSSIANRLKVDPRSLSMIKRYDQAYMKKYPFLINYLPHKKNSKKILEIGVGYGTVGRYLATLTSNYFAIDIAPKAIELMNFHLRLKKLKYHAQIASAFNLPYKSNQFDFIYSIGCLHHTGDISRCVKEIHRTLKANGKAIIMLYQRYSFRYFATILKYFLKNRYFNNKKITLSTYLRSVYDHNKIGAAAPYTEFTTIRAAKKLFTNFSEVEIDFQKVPDVFKKFPIQIFNQFGADLYITATK